MSSSPPAPDESLSNIIASPEYDGIISAIYHRDEDISNASRQLSVAKTAQKRAAPHMTAHPPAASPPGAPTFSSPFQSDFCQISQISVKPQSNFAPAPAADGAPDAPARRQRHDKLRKNTIVHYKYLGHLGIGLLLLHLAEEFGVKDSSKIVKKR